MGTVADIIKRRQQRLSERSHLPKVTRKGGTMVGQEPQHLQSHCANSGLGDDRSQTGSEVLPTGDRPV